MYIRRASLLKDSTARTHTYRREEYAGSDNTTATASLVIPNGDPRDGLFYPTLTLMIDSYNPLYS